MYKQIFVAKIDLLVDFANSMLTKNVASKPQNVSIAPTNCTQYNAYIHSTYMYQDSKLLAVVCFAELVEDGLWDVQVEDSISAQTSQE